MGQTKGADAYAKEPIVVVKSEQVYRLEADGTGEKVRTVVARIQSESGLKQVGVLSLPFAAKSEHLDWLYARVRHQDGTVTETPVNSAIEVAEPVTREAPFYSDLKQMQLPLKDLRVGDTLEWSAREVRTVAEAPHESWGSESFPEGVVVLDEELTLDAPKGMYVKVWSPRHTPVEADTGDRHTWRWSYSQQKPTVGAEADAAKEAEKKRVRTAAEEIDEREGKLPDVAWTTFKSWAEVGAWYRGLEGDRMVPDAEIKAKVVQLTAGKTTELEKVQAVYAYVATQIHYIGVAFGVGRYQPHTAAEVLSNQYGDCKDKHTLLAAMLEALGLHPDAVLMGVGIRFNEEVPSPGSFNHLFTRVTLAGKPVWLDTTPEVVPFGMLIYQIRDRRGLAIPETGTAEVVRTPVVPPFTPTQTMDAVGTMDKDGVAISKLTFAFRGDLEVELRQILRGLSPSQYDAFSQRICGAMGYGGTPSHTEVSALEDTSSPLKLSFDYKRIKGGDFADNRTLAQLAPFGLRKPDPDDPPIESIELGVPRVEISKSSMTLPKAWGVVLPAPIHAKSEWAKIDETYNFDKGVLKADRRVEVLKERVPQAQWKEFAKFGDEANLNEEHYVQMFPHDDGDSKTVTIQVGPPVVKETTTVRNGVPVAMADMDPAFLIEHAREMIPGMGARAAEMLLVSVKEKHPEQPGLWSALGDVEEQLGKTSEAIDDYRKELALHPTAYETYGPLAEALWKAGQRAEAEAALRLWVSSAPVKSQPPLQLTGYLLEDGKPADAAAVAKQGLSRLADGDANTARLDVLLGRAELAAGDKDAARMALVAAIKSALDADVSNDAADELANAGLELTLAEVSASQDVSRLEQESQGWTLDNYPVKMDPRQMLLESSWETMGWVLFREGNAKDAVSYARAAWLGTESARSGERLGEIEEALGHRDEAMRTYELAMAANGTGDERKLLRTRIDELKKAGVDSQAKNPAAELAKLWEFPAGPLGDQDGSSEYRLLLSPGKVEAVKTTGRQWVRGGEDSAALTVVPPALFPRGSKARLVRTFKLTCQKKMCEAALEP